MVLGRIWSLEFNGLLKMFVLQQEFNDFAFFVYISDLSKNMKMLILQQVFNGSGWKMDPLRIQRMATWPLARGSKCVTVVKNKLSSIQQHDDNVQKVYFYEGQGHNNKKLVLSPHAFTKRKCIFLMIDGCRYVEKLIFVGGKCISIDDDATWGRLPQTTTIIIR